MARIIGTPGDDILQDTPESDTLLGLAGNDTLRVSTGSDALDGAAGDDLLIFNYTRGDISDSADGGPGIDTLVIDFSSANEPGGVGYIFGTTLILGNYRPGGSNIEQWHLTGTLQNDDLWGGIGNDILYGGGGNDRLSSNGGVDVLNGGADVDVVVVDNSAAFEGQVVTNQGISRLTNGTTFIDVEAFDLKTGSGNDTITLFGDYNDTLTTTAGDDVVSAAGGNDIIEGGAGNDRLDGGTGNDRLTGGLGNDVLNGGTGEDSLDGGDGDDLLIFGYAPGDDGGTVIGGAGIDTLVLDLSASNEATGIGYIFGSTLATPDLRIGLNFLEQFQITGTARNDTLRGGVGQDILRGGGGDDTIISNEGDDRLDGGLGRDILIGGSGNDILIGGGGKDQLLYDTGSGFSLRTIGRDLIQGFTRRQDKIVLDKFTFTALTSGAGKLNRAEFATVKTNGQAARSDALIVYNSRNGNLFYNANGSRVGFGEGGNFAVLRSRPAITAADILVQF